MIDSQTIKFAKAKGGYVDQVPEWMLTDPAHVLERKYDGCRYRMIIEEDGIILQSRRVSKKTGKFVEKQDRVPHITGLNLKSWAGTVVEGEIVISPDACTSSEVVSIMGSDAEKAIARQEENGRLHWVLFDILFLRGQDVRGYSESSRRKILEENFLQDIIRMKRVICDYRTADIVEYYFHLSERRFPDDHSHLQTYNEFIEAGYEGGMLKDTNAVYGKGWWKMKPVVEVDVTLIGFTEGKGKFKGQIGAMEFGVEDKNGVTVYLGKCSGMDDDVRRRLTDYGSKLMGLPFEVKCQEVCRKGDWYSLRHPRFSRFREDLDGTHCTAEKLEREIK